MTRPPRPQVAALKLTHYPNFASAVPVARFRNLAQFWHSGAGPLQSSLPLMSSFCDIALPVPLDMVFTYRVVSVLPAVGARVLVPFRNERLSGVVTALHDREPSMQAKEVLQVLDAEPVLDPTLMQLGQWISQYYLAPLGEVFRTMLPLAADIKKTQVYSISEDGPEALHASATIGSSRRSRQDVETP